jgi:hypothetical protein
MLFTMYSDARKKNACQGVMALFQDIPHSHQAPHGMHLITLQNPTPLR